jgi:hypothetical protein
MREIIFSLEGSKAVIDVLSHEFQEVEISKPTALKSSGGPLDSPGNLDEWKNVVLLVTAIVQSSKALTEFVQLIIETANKKREGILLKDPQTGKVLIRITEKTTVDEVRQALS